MNTAPKDLSDLDFTKLQGLYQAQFGIIMNKQVLLLFETQKAAHLQELDLIQNLYQQQKQENINLYQEQIEVLNQKINQDKQQHENYIKVIDEAVIAIGNQKGAIITENPAVMVEHNRKYWIVCTLILLLSMIGAYLYYDNHNSQVEYQKVTNTLNSYPKIYKFQLLAQNVKIVSNPDDRVGEFLELTLQKEGEGAKVGANYIDDPEEKRILVPLHFSKEPL